MDLSQYFHFAIPLECMDNVLVIYYSWTILTSLALKWYRNYIICIHDQPQSLLFLQDLKALKLEKSAHFIYFHYIYRLLRKTVAFKTFKNTC